MQLPILQDGEALEVAPAQMKRDTPSNGPLARPKGYGFCWTCDRPCDQAGVQQCTCHRHPLTGVRPETCPIHKEAA